MTKPLLPLLAAIAFLSPACINMEQRVHRDMVSVLQASDLTRFSEHDFRFTPPISVEQQVKSIPIETQQLMIACARGDIPKLQQLLDEGHQASETYPVMHDLPPIKGKYTAPRSAFQFALYNNQVATIRYLQQRDPHLRWTKYDFINVCRFGHLEMAQYMLEQTPYMAHEDALDNAVKSRNIELVKLIVRNGITSEKALIIACADGQVDVVKTLLEAGFKPNQPSSIPPINEIFWADDDDKIIAMLDLLMKQGADAESRDAKAEAVLTCACRMNDEEKCISVMKTLIAQGAQINKKGTDGSACGETQRPLDEAISREQEQITAFLITQGASCEKRSVKATSILKDAKFWLKGYGLMQEECLIIQGIYSEKGCTLVYQSKQQQFELSCLTLEDCVRYLPAEVKHILILDKCTTAKLEKLQQSLNKSGKSGINIYAATNMGFDWTAPQVASSNQLYNPTR